jgi:hypothetical protein
MAQPRQSGCVVGKHADHVPPGPSSLISQQTDDKPDVDNYSNELENVNMQRSRPILIGRKCLARRIDFEHGKPKQQQLLACDTPSEGQIRAPAADAPVGRIGQDCCHWFARNQQADRPTPKRLPKQTFKRALQHSKVLAKNFIRDVNTFLMPPAI